MNVPVNTAQPWSDLIDGHKLITFQFLATRILVGRLVLNYRLDSSPQNKQHCINEVMEYFKKNVHIPQVQQDLNNIFGGMLL